MNTVRIAETVQGGEVVTVFKVVSLQSYVVGVISDDAADHVDWSLQFSGNEPEETRPDGRVERPFAVDFQGCSGAIHGLSFLVPRWHNLAGQRTTVQYPREMFPVVPGQVASFAFATEWNIPNDNRIRIGRRRGRCFEVSWYFKAQRFFGEQGVRVEVEAELPLKEFQVHFEKPPTLITVAGAQLVSRFADKEDLNAPVVDDANWVRFPLKEAVE